MAKKIETMYHQSNVAKNRITNEGLPALVETNWIMLEYLAISKLAFI